VGAVSSSGIAAETGGGTATTDTTDTTDTTTADAATTVGGGIADVRSRRREQTRAEILAAAWRLSERHGIAGLSLRELAREVGMQAPSLYTYFESKAAIYDAMFAAGFRELDAALGDIEVTGDPVDVLTGAIDGYLAFCLDNVPRYQLLFTRALPDWTPSAAAYAASVASFERMTAQLADLGIERQEDVDLLTALTSGLAAQQLANDPGGDRWHRLSREAAQMLIAHVRS
jgi:AcrR family transcriptional regulator